MAAGLHWLTKNALLRHLIPQLEYLTLRSRVVLSHLTIAVPILTFIKCKVENWLSLRKNVYAILQYEQLPCDDLG